MTQKPSDLEKIINECVDEVSKWPRWLKENIKSVLVSKSNKERDNEIRKQCKSKKS